MTIKLDYTSLSVVVVCTDCPWWYGFGFDREDGWVTGTRHQSNVHPGENQAATARSMARARLALESEQRPA